MERSKLIFLIFLVIGIILVLLGPIIIALSNNPEEEIKTTAIIKDIDTYRTEGGNYGHEVFVEYKVDNEKYISKLNEYASNFYLGKEIDIYYQKDDPYEIRSDLGNMITLIVFSCVGGTFTIIGLVGIILRWK